MELIIIGGGPIGIACGLEAKKNGISYLILEKGRMDGADPDLLNQVFDVFVRDFSVYATRLHGKAGNTDAQRALIRELIQAPVADPGQVDRVWNEQIYALAGQYEMAD